MGTGPHGTQPMTSLAGADIRGRLLDFCGHFLTYEITTRVFNLCDRLERGVEFSLDRGRPEIWAAAIVYTIAQVNGLFHTRDPLGVRPSDVHRFFVTRAATVSRKARRIRQSLNMGMGDPRYCTPGVVRSVAFMASQHEFLPTGNIATDIGAGTGALRRMVSRHQKQALRAEAKSSRNVMDHRQLPLFDD